MTNIQDLRKIYSAQGIKGFSSANRATFTAHVESAHAEALEIDATLAPVEVAPAVEVAPVNPVRRLAEQAGLVAPAPAKKGICGICGVRRNYSGNAGGEKAPRHSEMCNPCFTEGGWENTHSDSNHDAILQEIELAKANGLAPEETLKAEALAEIEGCWICHPELNLAKTEPKAGRSRMGMVIVAKGSEVHKSETFRVAAEAAGWTVEVLGSVVTEEDGEDVERYVAITNKNGNVIELAWNGRAYDYHGSSAHLGGKGRKVRNLKEALRLL